MKIALLGANGQLGSDLKEALASHDVVPLARHDFDVCDQPAMRARIEAESPDVVINTTAFHQVDLCETRADDAFRVNAVAVLELSSIVNRIGARLVHLSTDYVLSGEGTPMGEDEIPHPESVYARSKLAGEYVVRSVAHRHLVIRTCGLYGLAGSSGKGGNFVETIVRKVRSGEAVSVVDDQTVTPTWTGDLARQIVLMVESDIGGLVHASAEGSCSWFEFARTALAICGVDGAVTPTTSAAYNAPAKRPSYSVLENARLKDLGLQRMRHWKDGLTEYIRLKHGAGAPRARS